ncbi:TPA_asm: P [Pelargonium alphacytorhabdovirus 1]|nr:TPA_asm: P [Pelargonium alphacytorhabdovirus 1]
MATSSETSNDGSLLDFSSMPEPLLSYSLVDDDDLVANPNNDFASVQSPSLVGKASIPISSAQVTESPPVKLDPVTKEIITILKAACEESGIECTIPMVNQIKTLGKKELIEESHMVWYVRGIIMAHSSRVLPAVNDAVSELKTEMRHLMNVTNNASRATVSLEKAASGLRANLNDTVGQVRDMFDSTMKAVAESYVPRIDKRSEIGKVATVEEKIEIPKETQKPPVVESKLPINAETTFTAAIAKTEANKTQIRQDKVDLLRKIGVASAIIKELNDAALDVVLPNTLFAEIGKLVLNAATRNTVNQVIMGNLKKYIETMTAGPSGVKK